MAELILVVIIILFGSALFSGIEAALFSVSLARATILAAQKKRGASLLLSVKENMRRPITAIVILNNVFNIGGSMLVGLITAQQFGSVWIGLVSVVLMLLIVIFGEIIPKSVGERYAERIGLVVAGPLLVTTKIFLPIIWLIEKIARFRHKEQVVSEEEIRMLSYIGHLEGSIEQDEKEMIQKIFRLNDLSARDIMTPRTAMIVLEDRETLGALEEAIYSLSHSRLPIFAKEIDVIIGICHQRELLIALAKGAKERKILEFRHEVVFVPESMKADQLLPLFQKKRCHIAVVQDEFGGTSGLVTLEDVLEQLVGEIVDETDREIDTRVRARKLYQKILEKGGNEPLSPERREYPAPTKVETR